MVLFARQLTREMICGALVLSRAADPAGQTRVVAGSPARRSGNGGERIHVNSRSTGQLTAWSCRVNALARRRGTRVL